MTELSWQIAIWVVVWIILLCLIPISIWLILSFISYIKDLILESKSNISEFIINATKTPHDPFSNNENNLVQNSKSKNTAKSDDIISKTEE